MNYRRAALEQLSVLPAQDREFRHALIYSILSLGQADEVEAIATAAIAFIVSNDAQEKAEAYAALASAVEGLVG